MKQLIGEIINNFVVQEQISEGSMGIVYRAYHPDLQRYTAIKLLRPEMINISDSYQRFLQEARTAAQLQHRHIVNVINFGEIHESFYLMMEYIEGASMREVIQENSDGISIEDTAVIFSQLTDALSFAHEQGVLHRDLKPANILLTDSGDERNLYRAMISDFGLVKIASGGLANTLNGMTLGTPAYMSPEQCTDGVVDERSDIYSLGVTLYEVVTGKRPYPIRNLFDAVKFHTGGKFLPPKAHNPNIPNRLNILIRQMLNPDPNNRPASAAEVRTRLSRFMPNYPAKNESQVAERVRQGMKLVTAEPNRDKVYASIREETLKEASMPTSQCVVVSYQGRIESVHPPLIVGERLVVGRSNSSDVVLGRQERYISKKHCEIEVLKDRVVVRDLSSTNGTFLGDERLAPSISYDWGLNVDINLGGYRLSLRQLNAGEKLQANPVREEEQTIIQGIYSLRCPEAEPHFVPLHKQSVVIGRLAECQMILPSGRVSKKHVEVQLVEKDVFVVDLNSTNGTTLNGHKLVPGKKVLWDSNAPLCIADFEIVLVRGSS